MKAEIRRAEGTGTPYLVLTPNKGAEFKALIELIDPRGSVVVVGRPPGGILPWGGFFGATWKDNPRRIVLTKEPEAQEPEAQGPGDPEPQIEEPMISWG